LSPVLVPARRERRRRGLGLAVAALFALLALAPLARGASDPVGGGAVRLVLDKSFTSFLARDGVKLSVGSPGKLRPGVVVLPAGGGSMDAASGKGTVEAEGTLVFSGRKRVPFRNLTVKTKHSPLIAKVGGGQLKIATSAKTVSKRSGFGTEFSAGQLKLTAKVAERLNKKLRPPLPFEPGQALGTLISKTEPLTATILPMGRATLALDSGLVSKLTSRFVSLNPIAPAELAPGPLFTLPMIPEGALAPNASTGTLRTGGAIELLQLHAGQIFLRELWFDFGAGRVLAEVDIEPTPAYPGNLHQIAILDLNMSSASIVSDPKARTISVSGARLTLEAATAGAFNQAFAEGKEAFKAGEAAGTISFIAQAQ
jgi:hypothetical protein